MTFARRIIPEHFLASDWDDAWSRGWFRMRQTLFTTHFLEFDRQFHSAVWLRVGLTRWQGGKRLETLEKRNRRFRIDFHRLDVKGPSDAHEELYQRYRRSLAFEPAPTLKDLLYGNAFHDMFPSWVADLFDGDKLIASGIFDLGEDAASGINTCYDPEYSKFSLGNYLILKKLEFCRDRGLSWFYPGYVAPGQPRFDYKWSLGAETLEYLDIGSGVWFHRDPGDPVPDPLQEMCERLCHLGPFWNGRVVLPQVRSYLHLDINLNPQVQGMGLFDFPVFLDWFPISGASPPLVVVYDPRDGQYHVLHCRSVYRFERPGTDPTIFDSDLLHVERVLFSSADPAELAAVLSGFTVAQV
jgi:hypothetical protein